MLAQMRLLLRWFWIALSFLFFQGTLSAQSGTLINKIWDTGTEKFIQVPELIDRLSNAQIILLGEQHGFAPHQRRESFIIQSLVASGKYPAIALEMLQPEQMATIQSYQAQSPEYATALGIDLRWDQTGWPDWSFYEPIFQVALTAKLPLYAADLSEETQDQIEANGLGGKPAYPKIVASWQISMMKAHCDLISNERAYNLGLLQWQRDVAMAQSIENGLRENDQILLIAGRAHTRKDRGVSLHLSDIHNEKLISVAFIGTAPSIVEPLAALKQANTTKNQYDYIWFTPLKPKIGGCDLLK